LDALRQFPRVFGGLSSARKVVLAGTGGAAVAIAILLYSWSSQTTFVTLYGGLDSADSGRIVDDLRSQGVPFELSGGGASILVPEARVDELRMSFAAQGLPQGGNVGLELFDGNAFSATDFMQKVNFQRGLQGELARSIETFSSVEHARVHIVMPESSLFVAEEKPATASVVLQLKPGRALSADQVGGIAHLVSGAVEGLDKRNITVVDVAGNTLFDGAELEDANGVASASTHLQQQQRFEQSLEHDVQGLLDRSLGAGRAAVKVRATLNFDKSETETESFVPAQGSTTGQGTPRSSSSVTETYTTNGSASTGAVPGAVANIPGANADLNAILPENAATSYQRTENTSNFEMGKTVQRTQQAPGRVERLAVSLLLDESVPEAQAADLEQAVATAVGIDAQRGDQVAVSRLAFNKSVLEQAQSAFAAESSTDKYLGYGRLALPVVALLIGFIFFKMLLGAIKPYAPQVATARAVETAAAAPSIAAAPEPPPLPTRRSAALLPPPEDPKSDVERHVQALAQTRPEAVAEVVQAWLREE
jgi:flagellar M-ring protein FliF